MNRILAYLRSLRLRLRLREARRQADRALLATGKRHYVIADPDGRLIIMDRANFRALKRKHYIAGNPWIRDLEAQALYHTSYADGTGAWSK